MDRRKPLNHADTHPEAAAVQLTIYRRMTPAQRVFLAAQMSDDARAITRAGIQARHAEYDSTQVEDALRLLLLGGDLYRRAWPRKALLPP